MKTTLDIADDLLIEAKKIAIERRTTLKELVTRGLRREISRAEPADLPADSPFEIGELGLPVLKRRPGVKPMTLEDIKRLQEEIDDEDMQRALNPRRA